MIKLFKDKGFWRVMIGLTIPVMLQSLLTSSFSLVDTLLVSRLGTVALSSVGMGGQWAWLMNMVLIGFCSATTVLVSQHWGAKDISQIRRLSGISIIFAISVSIVFTFLNLFVPELVMRLFNSDKNVISAGTDYLMIVAFSYIPIALTNILSAILRSVENVKLPMYASLATTALNIFLDYCLIFGKLGFPEMKIKGAALATSISAWLGFIVIVVISLIKRNILIAGLDKFFVFSKQEIRFYLKKATPVVLNESMWGLGTFVYNIIFGHMGYEYFSALTIVKSFENMAFVMFIGICSAASVMIGKSIGKGKIDRGIFDSRRFSYIVSVLAIIVALIIVVFRGQLVSAFNMGNNISELTVDTARNMMIIYSIFFPLRMFAYLQIVAVFRSGGDTVTGARFEIITLWVFSVPATLIAVYLLKTPFLVAYAIMFAFEDIPKLIFCIRFYLSEKWIKPVTEEGRLGLDEYRRNKNE